MSIVVAAETQIWVVAHTRARCEKQVVAWAEREGIETELPQYQTQHRYAGKTVKFNKPLFPGYVFARAPDVGGGKIGQCKYVAQVLVPPDAAEFAAQLRDILATVAAGMEVRPMPDVVAGVKVSITAGPLRGLEGWVEKRDGPFEVILRLDFIGQAAAVRMSADCVERVDG
jgi:transcription antitermination factor NusG